MPMQADMPSNHPDATSNLCAGSLGFGCLGFFKIHLFVLKQNPGLDTRPLHLGNSNHSILNIVISDTER